MNGEALPREHGFPVRMVVPGLYGYVSAHEVAHRPGADDLRRARRLLGAARLGAAAAPIKTQSRIDGRAAFAELPAGRVTAGRDGVGAAHRRRARGGARRRRAVAGRAARDRGEPRHVADVAGRAGPRARPPRAAVPGHRPLGRDATRAAHAPVPDGATGWHTVVVDGLLSDQRQPARADRRARRAPGAPARRARSGPRSQLCARLHERLPWRGVAVNTPPAPALRAVAAGVPTAAAPVLERPRRGSSVTSRPPAAPPQAGPEGAPGAGGVERRRACARPRRARGHRRPPRGVPAHAGRARRAGHGDGVERRAGGRLRGELGQAAQGPVLRRLARHPRRRLRGRPAAAPPRDHPRAHPPPVRRAGRDRQPRARAGRLRRVRRPRLPGHGAVRRRPGPASASRSTASSSTTCATSRRSAASATSRSA